MIPKSSGSYDGGSPTNALYGSYLTATNTNCAITTVACGTTPIVMNVAADGYNYPSQQFQLGQTYGNIDITITITGNTNTNNEIFIGQTYGYSQNKNGFTNIVIGEAIKINDTGVLLKIITRKRALNNKDPEIIVFDENYYFKVING